MNFFLRRGSVGLLIALVMLVRASAPVTGSPFTNLRNDSTASETSTTSARSDSTADSPGTASSATDTKPPQPNHSTKSETTTMSPDQIESDDHQTGETSSATDSSINEVPDTDGGTTDGQLNPNKPVESADSRETGPETASGDANNSTNKPPEQSQPETSTQQRSIDNNNSESEQQTQSSPGESQPRSADEQPSSLTDDSSNNSNPEQTASPDTFNEFVSDRGGPSLKWRTSVLPPVDTPSVGSNYDDGKNTLGVTDRMRSPELLGDSPTMLAQAGENITGPRQDGFGYTPWLAGAGVLTVGLLGWLLHRGRQPNVRVMETNHGQINEYFQQNNRTASEQTSTTSLSSTPRQNDPRNSSRISDQSANQIPIWERDDKELTELGIDPDYRDVLELHYANGLGPEQIVEQTSFGQGEVGLVLDLHERQSTA